ncbi:hypothetical protein H646_04788 [Francisella tularensis subsp. tularensis 79201237]|nr:hypothetical protein B343_04817 [Francisella tularensis subsp. tularensis 80700075]EOA42686.1 hypothetical protein H645_04771 [Francisella tularensis subsp. tularensis 80700075]EOA43257.1 hypothetical protein H646_04788 [Francisella tularensis subsp. tularensis 79201237]EOA44702.1 hypothetical protein H647_04818 [Francisella tularensis subsp. tularensis 80700069]EOA47180.1 hypothetical protein H643_04811 [Francisella tularensis subsp. tularensis 1378]
MASFGIKCFATRAGKIVFALKSSINLYADSSFSDFSGFIS